MLWLTSATVEACTPLDGYGSYPLAKGYGSYPSSDHTGTPNSRASPAASSRTIRGPDFTNSGSTDRV